MVKRYIRINILLTAMICFACSPKTTSSTTKEGSTLKVMSYNVHHCNPPSKPGLIDVDAIASTIKKQHPDIVALQEIDVNTGRSGKINQAEQIAMKAGYSAFFFAKAIDYDGGQYGLAILSKYPVSNVNVHKLPTDVTTGGEPRVFTTATVTLPGSKTIVMGCTHLDAQSSNVNRLMQIREITKIAGETAGPLIIAGDFNAREGSEVINILDENFTRTCKKCQNTLPEINEKAIDFIGFRPRKNFKVLSHQVIQEHYASDHLPVVSVLKLKI